MNKPTQESPTQVFYDFQETKSKVYTALIVVDRGRLAECIIPENQQYQELKDGQP